MRSILFLSAALFLTGTTALWVQTPEKKTGEKTIKNKVDVPPKTTGAENSIETPAAPVTETKEQRLPDVIVTATREEENRYDVPVAEKMNKMDVVVVLGGMIDANTLRGGRPEFHDAVDRLTAALELVLKGRADYILISGGSGLMLQGGLREGDVLKKLAAISGVQQEKSFEVQVKARVADPQALIKAINSPDVTIVRHVHYQQFDTYFYFADEDSRRVALAASRRVSHGSPQAHHQLRGDWVLVGDAANPVRTEQFTHRFSSVDRACRFNPWPSPSRANPAAPCISTIRWST